MEEDIFSSEIDSFIEDLYQSNCNNGKVQRKLSRMSLSVPTKGLVNAPGENNCYLNSSVQLLWHMDVFRRSFRLLEGHACLENACIFCALKNIFKQFTDSHATVLAADHLRKAMANAFMDDHRFQLGRMDDAAECFENILHRLHNHIANSETADTCSARHCIPHQKFGQHILEQTSCQCKATSEPKAFYQFVHYVSASALVELVQSNASQRFERTFGENLKMIMQCGERRPCPDERRCLFKGKQPVTTIQTTLMNCPDVVTIGVIWDSDHPTGKFISSFMDSIGENLFLVDLFDNISDDDHKRIGLDLCGVVAYYGKHYTSFFYNSKNKKWYYFDDENVQELGADWSKVKGKFHRSRFQPLLLTYTNPIGEAVDVTLAPSTVNAVSKEKLLYQPPSSPVNNMKPRGHSQRHKKSRRSHHNSSEKLSKTNSDEACVSCKEPSPRPSKKGTPTKSNGTNASTNIGPRFGHSTLITDLNESFSNSSHNHDKKRTEGNEILVNDSKHSDSNVANETSINKTSEFLKKTFNHIKKNKASGGSKILKPVREQEPDTLKDVSPADVGFDLYHVKQKTKSLPVKRNNSSEANEPSKQLKSLERHQEILSVPKKTTDIKSETILPEYEEAVRINANASVDIRKAQENNLVDVPLVPERVDLIPEDDLYYKQGEFETLVNQGEHYANESERFEKEGDINSALHMCVRAKNAFSNACKLPDINESVIQFADLKRMQWAQKEKIFQQRLSLASLTQKVDLVLGKEPRSSTSDSENDRSSVSDQEVRQQLLPDIGGHSLTKNDNHSSQLDSTRNRNRGVLHPVEANESTSLNETIYSRGRSSPVSSISEKATPPCHSPHTNKSTKPVNISSNKLNVEGSVKSAGQSSPNSNKPVNTIEKLRQSSQHNPKLYDPSAYTKNKKERTIYDSTPPSPRKCLEKDKKEKSETVLEDSALKGSSSTLAEKLITQNLLRFSADKDTRPSRCAHCGWKLVENNAKLCFSCQSYI